MANKSERIHELERDVRDLIYRIEYLEYDQKCRELASNLIKSKFKLFLEHKPTLGSTFLLKRVERDGSSNRIKVYDSLIENYSTNDNLYNGTGIPFAWRVVCADKGNSK